MILLYNCIENNEVVKNDSIIDRIWPLDYYLTPYEFFTLVGDLSLESEWQQVSSGHLDSSDYPSWSYQ